MLLKSWFKCHPRTEIQPRVRRSRVVASERIGNNVLAHGSSAHACFFFRQPLRAGAVKPVPGRRRRVRSAVSAPGDTALSSFLATGSSARSRCTVTSPAFETRQFRRTFTYAHFCFCRFRSVSTTYRAVVVAVIPVTEWSHLPNRGNRRARIRSGRLFPVKHLACAPPSFCRPARSSRQTGTRTKTQR